MDITRSFDKILVDLNRERDLNGWVVGAREGRKMWGVAKCQDHPFFFNEWRKVQEVENIVGDGEISLEMMVWSGGKSDERWGHILGDARRGMVIGRESTHIMACGRWPWRVEMVPVGGHGWKEQRGCEKSNKRGMGTRERSVGKMNDKGQGCGECQCSGNGCNNRFEEGQREGDKTM